MQKKSYTWLLLLIAFVGGFLVYRYAIKPMTQRALERDSQAMAQKFDKEKEEIAADLSEILAKMDELDKDEAALRDQVEELRKDVQSDVK